MTAFSRRWGVAVATALSWQADNASAQDRSRETANIENVIAQFPAEGIDYTTGDLRGIIFDMSQTNGTLSLTDTIQVPRPRNIFNFQPSTELHLEATSEEFSNVQELSASVSQQGSSSWGLSNHFQDIMLDLAVARGLVSATVGRTLSPIVFETSGSRDASFHWARKQLSRIQGSVVRVHASYDYVEVFTAEPSRALLAEPFLRDFSLLSGRDWESLSTADRWQYESFFATYGTHYVEAAKFGASYMSTAFVKQCDLVIEGITSSSLKTCVERRVGLSIAGLLGIPFLDVGDINIHESDSCSSLTADGTYTSRWTSSILQTTQRWEGGSLQVAPSISQDGQDFSDWIEDVQQNPRSVPTRVNSIPDLFRDIATSFGLNEQAWEGPNGVCTSCRPLQDLGLDEHGMIGRVNNLDKAFEEYLYKALQEKTADLSECSLSCGTCGDAPILGASDTRLDDSTFCTCPEAATLESCQFLVDEDLMEVTVDEIRFAVGKGNRLTKHTEMKMYMSGIGDDYDFADKQVESTDTKRVDAPPILRNRGEWVYIEVVAPTALKIINDSCVGSAKVRFEQLGTEIPLDGPCVNAGGKRIGNNPRVAVDGSWHLPYCCGDTFEECPFYPSAGATSTKGLVSGVAAMLIASVTMAWGVL